VPSWSSFPFDARGGRSPRSLFPGLASPGYVPPSGFRTLLTASSSARPPGLFRPGDALGVRSSEPCSRPASRNASRRPMPSWRWLRGPDPIPSARRPAPPAMATVERNEAPPGSDATVARLQGFAPADRAAVRAPVVGRPASAMLSRASPLQGLPLRASLPCGKLLPCAAPPASSTGLGPDGSPVRLHSGVSIGAKAGRSLSRPAAPREVSHLVTPLDGSKGASLRAHASGREPRRRAPPALQEAWPLLPEPTQ
jgi:hypothetical protein